MQKGAIREDVTGITVTPIHPDSFDLKNFNPGFCLKKGSKIFPCFADCIQGDRKNRIWSVSRKSFGRLSERHYEEVDSSSMAVRNPMGIGVDILITYEYYSYSD